MAPRLVIRSALVLFFPTVVFAQAPAPDVTPADPAAEPLQSERLDPEPPPEAPPSEEMLTEAPPAASAPEIPVGTEAVEAQEEEVPTAIAVGKHGFWQPGILLQGWFFVTHEQDTLSSFRIRRAELKMGGDIVPDLVTYRVMIDPAKLLRFREAAVPVTDAAGDPVDPEETVSVPQPPGDTSILQDLFITFTTEYVDVSLGQFKTPVSWEGYNSSAKLVFPERALTSRHFGDFRDLGLRAEKKFKYIGYHVGIFNGAGLNRLDTNNQKDLALRVEVFPLEGIMLGAAGYASVGQRDEPSTKDRLEANARLEMENVLVQAEYIHGWNGGAAARTEGQGFYALAGYTFFERLQPVARVGYLDVDLDAADDETWHYEAGVNYYLRKHEMKLQTSYGLFESAGAGPSRHEFILSAQVAF